MNNYEERVEETAEKIRRLFEDHADSHGPTLAVMRPEYVRKVFEVNSPASIAALRKAGFWPSPDNKWRALFGVAVLDFSKSGDLEKAVG